MEPLTGLVLFLIITLALLGAVVVTGLAARRRVHLFCVTGALVFLGVTIYYAEKLGDLYDLKSAGVITPIHLAVAKTTVLAYLLPVITGIRTIRNPSRKPTHRKVAFLVLGLTLITALTGTAMVLMATPLS
jgi:hypothetical protein